MSENTATLDDVRVIGSACVARHLSGARDSLVYGIASEGGTMALCSVIVGKAADIEPGRLAAFEVQGVRITVANADGRLFAIDELCTHEQCSLAEEGALDGTVVTCGCHGAQFDVTTGEVLALPATEPLKVYPLRVDDGNIVIEM